MSGFIEAVKETVQTAETDPFYYRKITSQTSKGLACGVKYIPEIP